MDLSPGTSVIHPNHGLTTVTEITTRKVGGTEVRYVVLERPSEHLVLHVPYDQTDEIGLRAVIDEDQVSAVMAVLAEDTEAGTMGWRKLRAKNESRLASGDVKQIAAVVRDLTARDENKGLSMSDRRIYDDARSRLANELGQVLDDDRDIEQMIDDALER